MELNQEGFQIVISNEGSFTSTYILAEKSMRRADNGMRMRPNQKSGDE